MNFWRVFAAPWACKRAPFLILFIYTSSFSQNKWITAFDTEVPLEIYAHHYSSFEMSSSSLLTLKASPENILFKANSNLKYQTAHTNHLLRKSFIDESPLELFINNGRASVKMPWQGLFQDTYVNSEIYSWVHVSLKEVLDLFEQAEFDDNFDKPPENTTPGKTCFREKRGFLCFDSSTFLPIEGKLAVNLSATSFIQTQFLVTIFKNTQKSTFKMQK